MKFFYVIFSLILLVCSAVVNADVGKIPPSKASEKAENKQAGEDREGRYDGDDNDYYRHHHHHHNHWGK
ncbi:unnamed protein product [Allacma fusca]|uniref:Uncharacterized protein n=1 Tax=Allacma fusca TaxID=39272 RepID=A0A8J2NRG5_9HEXA|nr:unnamed protein product [Allacma fusca]